MRLILYSKPGCHLCEGLQEKLEQIKAIAFELEVRDITTRDDWFQAYQYEIPVLYIDRSDEIREEILSLNGRSSPHNQNDPSSLKRLPRFSPRASVAQVEQLIQKYIDTLK